MTHLSVPGQVKQQGGGGRWTPTRTSGHGHYRDDKIFRPATVVARVTEAGKQGIEIPLRHELGANSARGLGGGTGKSVWLQPLQCPAQDKPKA